MLLIINVSKDILKGDFYRKDNVTFYIDIPANDDSQIFTYLSYNLKKVIEDKLIINQCKLNIYPNVENLDSKVLGLLILMKFSYFKSMEISVDYFEEKREFASTNRFKRMLHYSSINPLKNLSVDFIDDNFFSINDKSTFDGISKRVLPYFIINEETFEWLFKEKKISFDRLYSFEKKEISYDLIPGNNLSQKNYNLQVKNIGLNNISFIDDLVIHFQSIFNYSDYTNLFDEKTDKFFYAKKYKPNDVGAEYFRLERKVENLMNTIITEKWSNIKLIFFLYIIISNQSSSKIKRISSNKEFDKVTNEVIMLSDSICKLLYEASKNVINHSEYKIGIISTRLSKRLVTTIPQSFLDKYENIEELIQISILDISNFGVTDSFLKNITIKISEIENDKFVIPITEDTKKSILTKLKRDQKNVKNQKFGFYDFFNPNPEIKILHQDIKILGHYGLHTFTKKILDTNSTVTFSTEGSNIKDYGFMKIDDNDELHFQTYTSNWYHHGTAIEIVMPQNDFKNKSSLLQNKYLNQNSKIKSLSYLNSLNLNKNQLYNDNYSFDIFSITNKDVENVYYQDEGEFIRFMESKASNKNSVIFFNLPKNLIEGIFLLIFDTYNENWNSEKHFLFLNNVKDEINNRNFWEFNILSGRTEIERLTNLKLWSSEYRISQISLSILKQKSELIKKSPSLYNSPFIIGNSPIPIELFIDKNGNFTKTPNESIFAEIVGQHLNEEIKLH